MSGSYRARPSVDVRTRNRGGGEQVDPAAFWEQDWIRALGQNGDRATADAERLGLMPLTIVVGQQAWTLRTGAEGIEARSGREETLVVHLDEDAFTDWIHERRTAMGLTIAGRVEGDGPSNQMFCAWDPILRAVVDGRTLYRPGEVTLRAPDGTVLDVNQQFRLDEQPREAAQFLAEAGFVLLKDVFTEEEMAGIDADLGRAVESAQPDDGESWWAGTASGDRYPCRILDFATKSDRLSELMGDPRFLAFGRIVDDGHEPGDPFGEHFSEVTAEGLVKRVGSVEGLACLPWHKDCERGGHSMFCSGLTIGICLTPVDEAHGGLDLVAGSHRAHVARSQVDAGLDLPVATLRAERGDVTVHLSCALHRSTHPTSQERRVVYTGFALPPRPGDRKEQVDRSVLARERADIADSDTRTSFSTAVRAGERAR